MSTTLDIPLNLQTSYTDTLYSAAGIPVRGRCLRGKGFRLPHMVLSTHESSAPRPQHPHPCDSSSKPPGPCARSAVRVCYGPGVHMNQVTGELFQPNDLIPGSDPEQKSQKVGYMRIRYGFQMVYGQGPRFRFESK